MGVRSAATATATLLMVIGCTDASVADPSRPPPSGPASPSSSAPVADAVAADANLATEIEQSTDATFIGEPMGGGLNFWDDVRFVHLDALPVPMQVGVSTRYWEFATADDPRLTIEPDESVPVTADDYFAGRDPALDLALGVGG